MSIQDRATLYLQFENDDVPTQSGFQNLIDSALNLAETQAQAMNGHLSVPELSTPIVSAAVARIPLINSTTINATTLSATNLSTPVSGTVTIASPIVFSGPVRYTQATISAAGTTQLTAAACSANFNIVAGVTDGAATGVFLPYGQLGSIKYVVNNTAASANLWPEAGGSINNLGANAAFGMTANSGYTVMCVSSAKWMVK